MPVILMAGKGVEEDQKLFWASSSDGVSFDEGHFREDLNSSQGPALTVFNGKLFTAWKGVEGDQRLFWASGPVSASGTNPSEFDGPLNVSNLNSSRGPALTVFNGKLFMAWKGVEGDQRLFWASGTDRTTFVGAPHPCRFQHQSKTGADSLQWQIVHGLAGCRR